MISIFDWSNGIVDYWRCLLHDIVMASYLESK